MTLTHPTQIDKYQIMNPIGAGNFGQVYRVFDRALGAEKAIKVLQVSDPRKFMESLNEAHILNKCKHKHIVTINEANVFPVNGKKRVVLDLEYIPEGSLENALSSRWVSAKESVEYVRGALLGLEHAHAQGFLHRDVKPGNILLAPAAPKLSDFGHATNVGVSLVGSGQGYITHLPPEYYAKPTTNECTDVFAVGVTFFRSLSNVSDWQPLVQSVPNLTKHLEAGTLLKRLGFEDYIPDKLRRIVRKACHPDPAKRFSSSREFGQSLDTLRFNIDWIRPYSNEWQGTGAKRKLYRCVTDAKTNGVSVTLNGRRIINDCRKFRTLAEAMTYMEKYVATTSLL